MSPLSVKFADTVNVRFECGREEKECLKTPSQAVSRRKLTMQDIVVNNSLTNSFDAFDSEDEQMRSYMENLPCDESFVLLLQ
jgi:hypothetical protein